MRLLFVLVFSITLVSAGLPAPASANVQDCVFTPSGTPTGHKLPANSVVEARLSHESCPNVFYQSSYVALHVDGQAVAEGSVYRYGSLLPPQDVVASFSPDPEFSFGVHRAWAQYSSTVCDASWNCKWTYQTREWSFVVGGVVKDLLAPTVVRPVPGGTPRATASAGNLSVYDNGQGQICLDVRLGGNAPPQTVNLACLSKATLGPVGPLIPLGNTCLCANVGSRDYAITVSAYYVYDEDRVKTSESTVLGGLVRVSPPTADDLQWIRSADGAGAALYVRAEVTDHGYYTFLGSGTVVTVPHVGQLLAHGAHTLP
ncbi:MAG TPA: hypothetical protein VM681_09190 [Candidatus Thermoplasmatota archaeon]|nr:hypothetical protein [Candidatus Thermoplasmatota archaeon]